MLVGRLGVSGIWLSSGVSGTSIATAHSLRKVTEDVGLITLRVPDVASDSLSERLRRWTRNPLGSARRGSNPLAVDCLGWVKHHRRSVCRRLCT